MRMLTGSDGGPSCVGLEPVNDMSLNGGAFMACRGTQELKTLQWGHLGSAAIVELPPCIMSCAPPSIQCTVRSLLLTCSENFLVAAGTQICSKEGR